LDVLEKSIEKLKNPPKYTTIRMPLDTGRMRARILSRPNFEHRPNPEERARLEKIIERLEDLFVQEI